MFDPLKFVRSFRRVTETDDSMRVSKQCEMYLSIAKTDMPTKRCPLGKWGIVTALISGLLLTFLIGCRHSLRSR